MNPSNVRPIPNYGEIAYLAFANKCGWKFQDESPMPLWDDLAPEERDLFESTANAVLQEKLKDDQRKDKMVTAAAILRQKLKE